MDTETKALMNRIACDAADKACNRIFVRLGVDIDNPIDTQQDFAALREVRRLFSDENMQLDLAHLRNWRQRMETVEKHSLMVFVGAGTLVLLGILWTGFKSKLGM